MPDYEVRDQPVYHPQATGTITPGMPELSHGPVNADVKHERSDANVRSIIAFALGLTAFAIIAHLVLAGLHQLLLNRERDKGPSETAITRERPKLPRSLDKIPGPVLQTDEPGDYRRFLETEEKRLRQPEKGMPIEEAMRIVANPVKAKGFGIRVRPQEKRGQEPPSKEKDRKGQKR